MSKRKKHRSYRPHAGFYDTAPALRAAEATERGMRELDKIQRTFAKAAEHQRAGRAAEVWHASTFNVDASLRGAPVTAQTTASLGQPNATADILIGGAKGASPVAVQVKYRSSAVKSAVDQAQSKYHGMQRVVPADQHGAAVNTARQSLERLSRAGDPRAPRYADASAQLRDRVKVGEVESRPLSRADALALANDPSRLTREAWRAQTVHAVRAGAVTGAAMGAAVSLVNTSVDVARGRTSVGEAAWIVARDTVHSGARGAVTAAGGQAIAQVAARAGVRTLARGAAPIAVAATAIEASGACVDYFRGKVTGVECAARVGQSVATGVGGYAGAEVGALIGSAVLPGFGTLVGGLVGGLLGSMGVGLLFK
jgi:hypothetical protein